MSNITDCPINYSNLSIDYLYDLQSVLNNNSLCDYKPTQNDSNQIRGDIMISYIDYIESIKNKRLQHFSISCYILIIITTILIMIINNSDMNHKSLFTIFIILFIMMIIFCKYYLYYGFNKKGPIDLKLLRERSKFGYSPRDLMMALFLLPEDYYDGYTPIYKPPTFKFPQDHSLQHYEYPTEWHWFFSTVNGDNNKTYSLQMMFLRQSILPPNLAQYLGISDIDNQLCESVLVIGDVEQQKMYQSRSCVIPGSSNILGLGSFPFVTSVGKNVLYSTDMNSKKNDIFPLRWTIQDSTTKLKSDINLTNPKPIFLQGDKGFSPSSLEGLGIGTIYYSIPRINIDGTINIDDKNIKIKGTGWIDHQIFAGTAPLARLQNPIARMIQNLLYLKGKKINTGWDYIIIQLDNNETYVFYRGLNDMDLSNNTNIDMDGTFSDDKGNQKNIKGKGEIMERFTDNNISYPLKWKIKYNDKTFICTSLIKKSYMNISIGQFVEQGSVITNENNNKIGIGWIENIGYNPNTENNLINNLFL